MRALGVRWWVDTSALDAPTHDMLAHLWSRASAEGGDAPPEATFTLVPLLDAMVATIAQTSSLYLLDEPLDHLARALSSGGGPWALHYRDIDECGALLAGLLATEAIATEAAWEHLPPGEDRRAVVPGELVGEPRRAEPVPALTSATRLRRGPWTDTVVLGDEALVLVADRPYRLGGVGHAIWTALADPRSVADLVGDVVDALGAHPEAADLTERGAADLLAQGLVEVAGITE